MSKTYESVVGLMSTKGWRDRTGDLLLLKAEQLSLISPVDWYLRYQSHQLLGSELRFLPLMMAVTMSGASEGSRSRI